MSAEGKTPSMRDTSAGDDARPPCHERVFHAGLIILVGGLLCAALVYVLSPEAPANRTEVEFANPRAYEFQIERLGGKAAVYAVRFNEWFLGLWHGRQLCAYSRRAFHCDSAAVFLGRIPAIGH
jgi:hypothetical protein